MKNKQNYADIITNVLEKYIAVSYFYYNSHPSYETIINDDLSEYVCCVRGWVHYSEDGYDCIHEYIIHLEIEEDKINIIQDTIKGGIVKELIDAGISQDNIIDCDRSRITPTIHAINIKRIYEENKDLFNIESDYKKPTLKPNVTSERLIELAKNNYDPILQEIAKHPNTPPLLLVELSVKFLEEVLNNPAIHLLLLEDLEFLDKIYDVEEWNTSRFYCSEITLPDYFINWAINSHREDIKIDVARNIKTTPNLLAILLKDKRCIVIQNLYKNQHLSPDEKELVRKKKLELEKNCPSLKQEDNKISCQNYQCSLSTSDDSWDSIPF